MGCGSVGEHLSSLQTARGSISSTAGKKKKKKKGSAFIIGNNYKKTISALLLLVVLVAYVRGWVGEQGMDSRPSAKEAKQAAGSCKI
jgi:hypothetical protein